MVKNLPANAGDMEMQGQSLGWEDPLEKEVATHCSILAWEIPQTEESGGLQSMGLQRVNTARRLTHSDMTQLVSLCKCDC